MPDETTNRFSWCEMHIFWIFPEGKKNDKISYHRDASRKWDVFQKDV